MPSCRANTEKGRGCGGARGLQPAGTDQLGHRHPGARKAPESQAQGGRGKGALGLQAGGRGGKDAKETRELSEHVGRKLSVTHLVFMLFLFFPAGNF